MSFWPEDEPLATEPEPSPAFELAGYRHIATGVLRSIRFVMHDPGEDYEPVFTGGPEVTAPALAALIALAEDRSEGKDDERNDAFLWHRLQAQKALGEFVTAGGQIP